jgi:hypothetical protein
MFAVALIAVCSVPGVASAKLPYFDLVVTPTRPDVGERVTITMRCFDDAAHTEPWSVCFGSWDHTAWVHPLDTDGELDRSDWIPIAGHPTPNRAGRGHITLDEPGAYDVLPLYRTWRRDPTGMFPDPVRIEVGRRAPIVPIAAAGLGLVGTGLAVAWRRRAASPPVTP